MRHLGAFSALDRATGKILWRWPMPEWPGSWTNGFNAPPVVGENLVVVSGLEWQPLRVSRAVMTSGFVQRERH
jgi:hypothetical protein